MALTKVGYHQISSHPETMPTQTSNSGKFLSTDGSNTSWNTVSTGVDGIVSTANATAITIDSSENVGFGVTPKSWDSTYSGILEGSSGSIYNYGVSEFNIGSNIYYNSGNKYKGTGASARYQQVAGRHDFFVAASGTADAAISWTKGFEVLNSGKARAPNGLLFGSDTAAANVLDDYEEGTWTPVLKGSSTAGTWSHGYGPSNYGNYVKVGNLVNCAFSLYGYLDSAAAGNTMFEMPFGPWNSQYTGVLSFGYWSGPFSGAILRGGVGTGQGFYLYESTSSTQTGTSGVSVSRFQTGSPTHLVGTAVFRTT